MRTPAAAPFIAFASTLALCTIWRATAVDLILLAIATTLSLALRGRLRRVFCTALLFAATATLIATRMDRAADERDRAFAQLPADEFTTVRAPVEGGWRVIGDDESDIFELRASRFEVVGPNGDHPFDTPIAIILPVDPPPAGASTTITAEGWL